MAGAGYRTWTAGEQLTDEKMQLWLQDQTVMVFADATARTTALTGVVAEGMVTYLEDVNTVEVYDGAAWAELTGDPDIFTEGTAGQYLQSAGTAGVVWAAIESATDTTEGLLYGATTGTANSAYPVSLGFNAGPSSAVPGLSYIGNTSIGVNAGQGITTGHNNVAIGGEAGINLTTGAKNVFVGSNTGQPMTTQDSNTFIGFGAGFQAEGSGHVAVGAEALQQVNITSGASCVAIGNLALKDTQGDGNTAVGAGSGSGITTGYNNTVLGWSAGLDFFTNTINQGYNNTLLGAGTSPSADGVNNEITLGNSSIATLRCQVTSITALSDERDKTEIKPLPYGLDFVKALKPVSFDWNMRDGAKVGVPDIGFIAQDLAALEDQHDAERLALTLRNNPDKLEATQGRLIPILVKAIQELTARVEELENAR